MSSLPDPSALAPEAEQTPGRPGRRNLLLGAATLGGALTLTAAPAMAATTLRPGSKGAEVKTLQTSLNALHFWCGTPDGKFGQATTQAVYALQSTAGLKRDGVVGAKTQAALARKVQPSRRITKGTGIEINIDRQLLIVTEGGKMTMILHTSTAAGTRYYSHGSWKTSHTPRGSYSVYYTHPKGWQTGSLGRMYRPAYFKGGYAFHGSTSIPPYPASHGCARVTVGAMDLLWSKGLTRHGVKVITY